MKIKIIYSIISVILFTACNIDDELSDSKNHLGHPQNTCVRIITSRETYNLQAEDSDIFHHQMMTLPGTRAGETRVAVEKEYQCSDMLILPQCQSKIWLGNVITRNSAMNSTFKPIDGLKQAIDVSTAMKIYESKGLQDIGKQVMSQRAGATKIVVENKTESPQVKE